MSAEISLPLTLKWLLCVLLLPGAMLSAHALPEWQETPQQPFEPLYLPLGDKLRTLPSEMLKNPAPPVPENCTDAREPLVWSEGITLTLNQALDRGLCRNPRVQSAWSAIKKGAASLGQTKAALLPRASASIARNKQRIDFLDLPTESGETWSTTSQLNLSYRLYDGGSQRNQRDANEWALEAALYGYDQSLLEALLNIVSSYYEALANQATAQSTALAVKVAKDLHQIALRREKGGVGNHNETLQSQTAWLRAELEFKKAHSEQLKAQALLRYHLGETSIEKNAFVLVDDGDLDTLSDEELEHWYELALNVNPLLRQNLASIQSAASRLRAVERDLWPTLDVGASYNHSATPIPATGGSSRREEYLLGLTLNIPLLFDGFNWNYRVLEARSQLAQAQSDSQEVQTRILGDVTRTYHELRSLQGSQETTAQLQAAAEATHQSALNRLSRGAADITEVLNAQKVLSDARRDRIQYLSNWRAARLKLRIQTGILERLAQQHSSAPPQ
ncbi:MAG: TolC family protein [Rhodoferax sp.]|nr:TolC family protein [Rhodoferax sp.]